MPQRICRECKDRLKNYAAFHRQFQIMDEFFRGRLNSLRQANATSTPSTSQEDFQYRLTANGRVLKVFRIKHADGSVTYDERPSEPSPKKAGSSSQNSSRLPLDRCTNKFLVHFCRNTKDESMINIVSQMTRLLEKSDKNVLNQRVK